MQTDHRKNIPHFSCLNENEFKENAIVGISLKVDGFGLKIGLTEENIPFIESSRSGLVTARGSFLNHTSRKTTNEQRIFRAKLYDEIFDLFLDDEKLLSSLIPGQKLHCECVFKPMCSSLDGKSFKQVHLSYPSEFFESDLNLFVYRNVVFGKYSQMWIPGSWRSTNANLQYVRADSVFVDYVDRCFRQDQDFPSLILPELECELSKYFKKYFNFPFEGFVLEFQNGQQAKIIEQEFTVKRLGKY